MILKVALLTVLASIMYSSEGCLFPSSSQPSMPKIPQIDLSKVNATASDAFGNLNNAINALNKVGGKLIDSGIKLGTNYLGDFQQAFSDIAGAVTDFLTPTKIPGGVSKLIDVGADASQVIAQTLNAIEDAGVSINSFPLVPEFRTALTLFNDALKAIEAGINAAQRIINNFVH